MSTFFKLKIKRKYLAGGINPTVRIITQVGEHTVENGKEIEIRLPSGENKITFTCMVEQNGNQVHRTKELLLDIDSDFTIEISCYSGIISIDKKSKTVSTSSITSIKQTSFGCTRKRRDYIESFYGWRHNYFIRISEDEVVIQTKKCPIKDIERVYLSPSALFSRGYMQILLKGEKPAKTVQEALKAKDVFWLEASGQNEEASRIKQRIELLQKNDKDVQNERLDIIRAKYKCGRVTNVGASLTPNGILYGVWNSIQTYDAWSPENTKFVAFNDIDLFELKGSIHQEINTVGGGLNLDGALLGGLLFGGVGAILGSKIGTNVSTYTQDVDDRFIYMRSPKLPKDIVIAFGNDVDSFLIELRKAIPEKEYSSTKGFVQTKSTSVKSVSDELRNMKSLLDDGIITQEEFDAKKKQLLGL